LHLVLSHRGSNGQQRHYKRSFPQEFLPAENFSVRLNDLGSLVSESTLKLYLVFSGRDKVTTSASEKPWTALDLHTMDFFTFGSSTNTSSGFHCNSRKQSLLEHLKDLNSTRPAIAVFDEPEMTRSVTLHLDPVVMNDYASHYPRSQLLVQIEAALNSCGGASVSSQCVTPFGSGLTVNLTKLSQLGDNNMKKDNNLVEMRIVGATSVVLSIKKEMLSRTLRVLTKINSGDICVQSSNNESVALLRQTHQASHLISEENSQEADAILIAVYRRLREKLNVSP